MPIELNRKSFISVTETYVTTPNIRRKKKNYVKKKAYSKMSIEYHTIKSKSKSNATRIHRYVLHIWNHVLLYILSSLFRWFFLSLSIRLFG